MEAIQDLSAEHEQPTVAASADVVDDMTSFFWWPRGTAILVHLEELHVYVSEKSDILVAAISALLRNTACLTSLVFRAHSENQLSQTFIHALATNSTLEYLEILGKWDTAEPPGPFWSYVKTGDAPAACWEPLFESLSSNTSIRYLRIIVRGHFSYAGHLARAVGRSRSITQMFYEEYRPEWDPSGFLSPLSRELDENYNLLEVSLSNTAKMDAETTCCWFKVREVSRRNSGLVKRAGAAIQSPTLDWYAANALEKVSRRPVLVRELAEKEGLAVDEVAKMLRSRLVSVDGNERLYETDRHLNVDCWRLVRRYLSFDDVKRCPVAKPDDPMAE
ncbi:hypothetical protein MRX96_002187 [Rhipicephalus microplus]